MLGADGLGVVATGSPQTATVSTITHYLGQPTSTVPGNCHNTTEVEWGDLSLEFTSGKFAGYRYIPGGLAVVGNPTTTRPTAPGGNPQLITAAGATLGMTLAQVRHLYPSDDFSGVGGGAIVVHGTTGSDRLFLGFFASDPSTPLQEIKGGATCGDF
jgi:hypothetical protein